MDDYGTLRDKPSRKRRSNFPFILSPDIVSIFLMMLGRLFVGCQNFAVTFWLMNFSLSLSHFPECDSQCSEEQPSPMEVVQPHVLAIRSLVPVQKSSPERRNQKEIVAGEERPKFLTIKQTEDAQGEISFCVSLSCRLRFSYFFIYQKPLHK
jgi:hypothetical protein